MKKVLGLLIDFQRKHFDLKLYVSVAVFLIISLFFNYRFDFENSFIDSTYGTYLHWFNMFWWQSFPFLIVCFLLYAFNKKREWLTSKEFWMKFLIGFGILALDRSFYLHNEILKEYFSGVDLYFIRKCARWFSSMFTVVIPLIIISLFIEKGDSKNYYGLAIKKFDARPYFTLLAIAVFFIGIGSFFGDIQAYYPRFAHSKGEAFASLHDLPVWLVASCYELFYGSDFLGVEMIFRGFLVFAFARTLGGYAVLAMIASYCFLHFGKPMPEAASSIFGGYILGIVSYNTRNVWGGVIIHLGVAWSMELFGYLQRLN
ncbi:MAG: CPBP family intramembrane metalloprotease [Cyclobacteriaceae bacterium]